MLRPPGLLKNTTVRLVFGLIGLMAGAALGVGLAAVVAVGGTQPAISITTTTPTTTSTESKLMGLDRPLLDGVAYPNIKEAQKQLIFTPLVPSTGTLRSVFVRGVEDPSQRSLGLVYDDAEFGRFVVLEEPTEATVADLQNLADTCHLETGCDGSWTMIRLADGTPALEIASSVSSAVTWPQGSVLFSVYGPVETFSAAQAESVANSFGPPRL